MGWEVWLIFTLHTESSKYRATRLCVINMNITTCEAFNDPRLLEVPEPSKEKSHWDFRTVQTSFNNLYRSLSTTSRESCLTEDLSQILIHFCAAIDQMKTECARIGAISKDTVVQPPSSVNSSVKLSLQHISVSIRTLAALFFALDSFMKKYSNEPFSIENYVNMNRVAKAERRLQLAHGKMQQLYRFVMVLKLHSIAQVFVCAVRWKNKVRGAPPTLALGSEFLESKLEELGQGPLCHEGAKQTPQAPITSYTLDISLNSSLGSFVSTLPKTKFTPDNIQFD